MLLGNYPGSVFSVPPQRSLWLTEFYHGVHKGGTESTETNFISMTTSRLCLLN